MSPCASHHPPATPSPHLASPKSIVGAGVLDSASCPPHNYPRTLFSSLPFVLCFRSSILFGAANDARRRHPPVPPSATTLVIPPLASQSPPARLRPSLGSPTFGFAASSRPCFVFPCPSAYLSCRAAAVLLAVRTTEKDPSYTARSRRKEAASAIEQQSHARGQRRARLERLPPAPPALLWLRHLRNRVLGRERLRPRRHPGPRRESRVVACGWGRGEGVSGWRDGGGRWEGEDGLAPAANTTIAAATAAAPPLAAPPPTRLLRPERGAPAQGEDQPHGPHVHVRRHHGHGR